MPKRELLHEWMHRFDDGYSILRVWAKRLRDSDEFDVQNEELGRIFRCWDASRDELIETLAHLDYVNAVEVLDKSGNGRLVYVDWP